MHSGTLTRRLWGFLIFFSLLLPTGCSDSEDGEEAGSLTLTKPQGLPVQISIDPLEEGSRSIVRSTVVGGDYGLLDPGTFDPRPSFLAYVMFRRTVERSRLETVADRSQIKAHGFCTAGGDGRVTAVLSNPSDDGLAVEIYQEGKEVARARQWTVGAGGDLTATRASIEGQRAGHYGTIPDPPGTPVYLEQGSAYARVDPNSLVFVVLEPEDPAPVCCGGC